MSDERPRAFDSVPLATREFLLWADSGPTRVASGRTGVRTKSCHPFASVLPNSTILARARLGRGGPEPYADAGAAAVRQSGRSSLWYSGLAHALVHAFPSREIDWMVAMGLGPESCDREVRVDLQAGARSFARFFDTIEMRQRCGEAKPSCRRVLIELKRAVQPCERFLVAAQMEIG
jgi:hypothetical protein